jgi:uncharacterized protein (TIGR03437 family)
MSNTRTYSAIALVALLSPMVALADINDTKTLAAGTALNLDTDATASSGGDILWTGTQISFQGNAKGGSLALLGITGASGFSTVTLTILQAVASFASNSPIPASGLPVGTVLGVVTNAGNGAKLLVTAVSGTSITLQFTTFGATGGSGGGGGTPTITKILNNYSLIPNGFVNSGVSPSTLFVAMGSNMSDPPPAAGLSLNTTAAPGLPTTSAGASANIVAGGKTFPVPLYYASPTQIAGVIPAGVPTGTATMTVTYKGATSAAFSFNVVAQALGLGTYGPGTVIATDAVTGVLVDYTHSAKPGGTYVFWGSGGGADTADSDSVYTTSPHSVNQSNTQFYFGSTQGTVLYSGSSGFPGLMQMNVTIPTNVATGCGVSVAAIVNGVPSNFGPLPIDLSGGVCHDSVFGVSGTDLSGLGSQGTVRSGSVFVGQFVSPPPAGTTNIASASFSSTTGGSFSGGGSLSFGSCSVSETASGTTTSTTTPLDAGTISLSGPGVSTTLQSLTKGTYFGQPSSITAGGAYVFTGGGGADVGAFTASVTVPNPILNFANASSLATVTRSGGIQVNWTGGAAGSYVLINGSSSDASGNSGSFTCFAPQSALGFLVPSFVASVLPAGNGTLLLENSTLPAKFTAPKLDQGYATAITATQINVKYQ